MTDSVKGALLTMFGGMCWGVSGCVGQYLFTRQGMDSTWLVPIRLFLAGVILCIYYGVRNWRQLVNPWRSWRNARDLVIYGLAGVSFCQFTYFLTIQLSSAGVGTILQDLSPVLILLVVCIQQKRAPRLFEVFSIVLALGGVFMLTTHGSLTNMAVSPAALVVGIISAFCVVIYTIWPQNLQKQYPTPMLQGWAFLMGHLLCAGVPPVADKLRTQRGRHCRYCGSRAHRQRAGVQLLHERRQVHWAAEIQPVQLCGTGYGGHHQHAGARFPLYRVGRHRLCLHLFDAGAVVHQQRKAGQKRCKRMITGQVSTKAAETV